MRISKIHLAMAGVAALIGPMRLFAADTAASSTELEAITVTAEKRSRERTDRAAVHDHLQRRRAPGEEHQHLLRLRNEGAEPGVCPHRGRRRYGAYRVDPRHLRRQCHGLLYRRHAAARFSRSAGARHRPHRSAARTAGHAVRRALDGRRGAHHHQGTESERFLGGCAWRHLLHRSYQSAELHRRRRGQHPLGSGSCRASPERLLRHPGRLLQAQLLH